ncbi:MAG: glycoside hydrolase family 99-like domain-containing protein, partial [Bacteroidaceae bacterium]|nr:glycoside hydrolase family 99-like domain-containing protein [Bacteroidaceae bacterium]
VYVNATPENFKHHILQALKLIENKAEEHRILFLRSWNEWAEGNYVEPDLKYGHGFLNALQETIKP